MAHHGLITVSYVILWYVCLHFYWLQDIMASRVTESRIMNICFNTYLDTNKFVFTSDNDKLESHDISE